MRGKEPTLDYFRSSDNDAQPKRLTLRERMALKEKQNAVQVTPKIISNVPVTKEASVSSRCPRHDFSVKPESDKPVRTANLNDVGKETISEATKKTFLHGFSEKPAHKTQLMKSALQYDSNDKGNKAIVNTTVNPDAVERKQPFRRQRHDFSVKPDADTAKQNNDRDTGHQNIGRSKALFSNDKSIDNHVPTSQRVPKRSYEVTNKDTIEKKKTEENNNCVISPKHDFSTKYEEKKPIKFETQLKTNQKVCVTNVTKKENLPPMDANNNPITRTTPRVQHSFAKIEADNAPNKPTSLVSNSLRKTAINESWQKRNSDKAENMYSVQNLKSATHAPIKPDNNAKFKVGAKLNVAAFEKSDDVPEWKKKLQSKTHVPQRNFNAKPEDVGKHNTRVPDHTSKTGAQLGKPKTCAVANNTPSNKLSETSFTKKETKTTTDDGFITRSVTQSSVMKTEGSVPGTTVNVKTESTTEFRQKIAPSLNNPSSRTKNMVEAKVHRTFEMKTSLTSHRKPVENKVSIQKHTNMFKVQDSTNKTAVQNAMPTTKANSNIEKLLKWIAKRINQYHSVNVTNFTSSWEDGIALCALINYLLGDEALQPTSVKPYDPRANFELAINAASAAGVPALIDATEMTSGVVDRRSMITYLHTVYKVLVADKQSAT